MHVIVVELGIQLQTRRQCAAGDQPENPLFVAVTVPGKVVAGLEDRDPAADGPGNLQRQQQPRAVLGDAVALRACGAVSRYCGKVG